MKAKKQLQFLKNQNKLMQIILDNAQISVWLMDLEDKLVMSNKYFNENVRLTDAEILISRETTKDLLAKQLPTQYYEEKLTFADGQVHILQIIKTKLFDEDGNLFGILGIGIDITERKQLEDNIRFYSYHDQLTGLYNRRYYEEEIARLDDEGKLPITLLLADMNGLKLINDVFGHQEGDVLLQKFADVLKRVCRKDEIIVRLGGDEFIIILPGTTTVQSEKIAQRIKSAMVGEKVGPIELSASIGYATKHSEEQKISAVFQAAERKMYEEKAHLNDAMKKKLLGNPESQQ